MCLGGSVLSYEDDGSWKGEGLAESQDYGQYDNNYQYPVYGQYAYGYHSAAPLGADGRVVDTPEVAQAKAAHYAALAAVNHGPAAPVHYGAAPIQLTADGKYIQDTPEVAQAKAAHLAALAAANHGPAVSAPIYANSYGSYGAAHVELTADGKFLKDTPEVAQAKAAHFAALNAASHSQYYQPENIPIHQANYGIARIELTPNGEFLKDTPEVAHAKAAHLAAHAAVYNRY